MAKNVADPCMFCDAAPCVCNAPKKAPVKRAAKKATPAKAEAPVEIKPEPQSTPKQPSLLTQRKALDSSKKPLATGPIKPMARSQESVDREAQDMEVTRAVRMLNQAGMLSEETKKAHAHRLRYPRPGVEVSNILDRLNPNRKE